ncbi:MAG: pentapeptide repeat-containing protein [Oscillatoria sp. PMC 1068.18]|nr:pentapeptide repeat-containing protein [Oscillatoria sp. PMC 1076.18]MEC4987273.1 pentapeptide repeat-containing protein [Oscillatoria sp. PMC 1068.18]
MLALESYNQYPDCLLLGLTAIPCEKEQLELYLTLNFNQQWENLLEGKVKFALRGGQLSFHIKNGVITTQGQDFSEFSTLVKDLATDSNLVFNFAVPPGVTTLQSSVEKAKLGTLQIQAQPYHLEAQFTVTRQDICITEAEGLWHHDISPNKHAILDSKLALFLLTNKFTPYLSLVKLSTAQLKNSRANQETTAILGELENVITKITAAETNNFLELAKIAQINPLTDLAGGNLMATNLTNINLSSANLFQVNLRGAELDDADLSSANLQGAKLSGADLSGAYLSEANLSFVDLHRASLALANLSGANLENANLLGANLSNVNLSGAKVTNAKFGKNPGITEETKQNLQQRGAIFKE